MVLGLWVPLGPRSNGAVLMHIQIIGTLRAVSSRSAVELLVTLCFSIRVFVVVLFLFYLYNIILLQ